MILYSASAEFAEVVNAQAEAAGVTPGGEGFSELLAQVYTQFIDGAIGRTAYRSTRLLSSLRFFAQAMIDSADPVNYSAGVVAMKHPDFI